MNQHADDGLSDVLRDMANGQHHEDPHPQPMPEIEPARFKQPASARPRPTVAANKRNAPRTSRTRPTANPSSSARRSSTSPNTRGTRNRPIRKSSSHGLKATAAPLLATVGVLLLIPGIWSVLTLSGMDIAGSKRDDAKAMATAMLVCWPIAICLLVTAAIFFTQILKEKKQ